MAQYSTIAESNNFIVLDAYTKYNELHEPSVTYQSEASLEREFIQDLVNQGYEYRPDISTPDALLANARVKIQELNDYNMLHAHHPVTRSIILSIFYIQGM